VNSDVSPKDSIELVNLYIHDWVKKQTIAYHCRQESDETKTIEKKVAAYRNELLLYEFKNSFLEKHVDTNVSEAELQAELKKQPEENKLDHTIVRARLIKIARNAPNISLIKKLITHSSEKEHKELKSLCLRFAERFHIQMEYWLDLDFLLADSPFSSNFSKYERKGNFELVDDEYVYLLNIVELKAPGTIAPMQYLKEKLKASVIHHRKVKKWAEFEEKLYEEAIEKKEIEIKKNEK
jgi:hypothetical protein